MQHLTDREIREAVISLVHDAKSNYGIQDGWSGKEACRKIGLPLKVRELGEGTDGGLTDQHEVIVNSRLTWQERIEFTIFHEITHYLIREDEDGTIIGYFTDTLGKDEVAYDRAIERCCHWGAAEFLIPRKQVRESIRDEGFSVNLVQSIARRHGASIIAAAIQLADNSPVDCYVVICGYGWTPKRWDVPETLFAEYVAMCPGMGYPLARYSEIPHDHLFRATWELKMSTRGPSYVPYPSGKRWHCEEEAIILRGRVVGILYPDGRPVDPSKQMALPIG